MSEFSCDLIIDRIQWGLFLEALRRGAVSVAPTLPIETDTCVIHTRGTVVQYRYVTEHYTTMLGNPVHRWNAERVWFYDSPTRHDRGTSYVRERGD